MRLSIPPYLQWIRGKALGSPVYANENGALVSDAGISSAIIMSPAADADAYAAAAQRGQRNVPYSSGISIKPSVFGLKGDGDILDFSALAAGPAVTVLGYIGDINVASSYAQPHTVEGLHIVGPGTAALVCLQPEGTSTQIHKYQITFRNVTFRNWDCTFRLNRDTWGWVWESCHFRPVTASTLPVFWFAATRPDGPAMTNAGERMSVVNCTALNSDNGFALIEWGNTDFHLVTSSVDQFAYVVKARTGQASVQGGHFENLKDLDHWFSAEGANASILIDGAVLYLPLGATYSRTNPFNADEACRFGGITVGDIHISCAATFNRQTWCHGYGRAVADTITLLDSSPRPPFSRFMNIFRDSSDTSALTPWTFTGTGAAKASGWMQPFNLGVGVEPMVGDTVVGATSGATMQVVAVKKTSGRWGVDAAGQIYAFSRTGSHSLAESFQVGGVEFAKVNSGGTAPANYAISFDGTNANAQTATTTIPWDPKKHLTGACVVRRTACQAVGKNLTAQVEWLDEAAAVIGSAQTAFTVSGADAFESASRTRFNLVPPPAGTRSAKITFTASAASGTGGTILISDIIINAL